MAREASSDRSRSPRAPKYSLGHSLNHARKIYDAVHRSSIDSSIAYEVMGFAGKSGTSATALGSVRQYGLIEGTGEKTRISDLAMAIFEPSSSSEQASALLEAAERPDVFRTIRERFNGRTPSADEPVRAFLIRELGFSKSGADETLKSLRDTEAFVASYKRETAAPSPSEGTTSTPEEITPTTSVAESSPAAPALSGTTTNAVSAVRVALSKECTVEMHFYGALTPKALKNLVRYVELMHDAIDEE